MFTKGTPKPPILFPNVRVMTLNSLSEPQKYNRLSKETKKFIEFLCYTFILIKIYEMCVFRLTKSLHFEIINEILKPNRAYPFSKYFKARL